MRESYKRWLLSSEFDVVFDGGSTDNIEGDIELYKPDVILMDIDFPGGSNEGIKCCKFIHKSFPDVRVVFVTHYNDPKVIISALRVGANGYFSKSDELRFLREIIERVNSGYVSISPTALRSLINFISKREIARAGLGLEGAVVFSGFDLNDEKKILYSLSRRDRFTVGYSNEEIAREFFTNEKRIKNMISNILLKMSARNRAHAVAKAIIYGVISVDEIIRMDPLKVRKNSFGGSIGPLGQGR